MATPSTRTRAAAAGPERALSTGRSAAASGAHGWQRESSFCVCSPADAATSPSERRVALSRQRSVKSVATPQRCLDTATQRAPPVPQPLPAATCAKIGARHISKSRMSTRSLSNAAPAALSCFRSWLSALFRTDPRSTNRRGANGTTSRMASDSIPRPAPNSVKTGGVLPSLLLCHAPARLRLRSGTWCRGPHYRPR